LDKGLRKKKKSAQMSKQNKSNKRERKHKNKWGSGRVAVIR
jgi:hypothetical protein